MTILTANIAYGLAGMGRLVKSAAHQLHIHGWGILTYQLFPSLRGLSAEVSLEKRRAYVGEHKNLRPLLTMVEVTRPDVLVLNELIYELYRDEIERDLRRVGFRTFAWGVGSHYPGTTISTLVASRDAGESVQCDMPQWPTMGGGAGMAGIRVCDHAISVFGMHLAYRSPALFARQIKYISEVVSVEQGKGRDVILAGDWNEPSSTIVSNPDFLGLGLVSAADDSPTCPTYLPRRFQQSLDHVFVPPTWQRQTSKTIDFGSDHRAVSVEVLPSGHGASAGKRLP